MLNRKGLTFIELLLVFTIIGLMASIAMPRLRHMKDRALVATLKRDLRTFAMHQESHYYDRATYTDDLGVLVAGGYRTSPDVTISVNEATILGWSATAEHGQSVVECYLFIGDAAPIGNATTEGALECN